MKIISGKHKNLLIPTIKSSDYRPTTSKFRAALFSVLSSGEFFHSQPIIKAKILDLFSGTGSLSFEALSRGAKYATLVDINSDHIKAAQNFAKKIGEEDNMNFIESNVLLLPKTTCKYNIIFMDPPYYKDLCAKTLVVLTKNNWIDNGAIIAMEMEKSAILKLETFRNLSLIKEKIYGNTKLVVLRYLV